MIWTFDRATNRLSHDGPTPWSCAASNAVVAGLSGCPNGTYTLGAPEYNEPEETANLRAMGPYFIPIYNIPGHDGIGIHGGGSAAAHPLAARQGFFPTENCIRVQNDDLYRIAQNVSAGETIVVQ